MGKPRILVITTAFHHTHRFRLHNFLPYLASYLDIDVIDIPIFSYDLGFPESLAGFTKRVVKEILEGNIIKYSRKDNINLFTIRSLCTGDFGPLCSISYIHILSKKLHSSRYNAILTTPWIAGLISLIARKNLKGTPVVYEDVDRFYDFFRNDMKRILVKSIEYNVITRSDAVIAASPYLYLEDLELRKRKPTYFIPNGIEYDKFRNAARKAMERDKYAAVYVGAIEWWSGLDIAIKAFQRLVAQVPQARLYIIGDYRTKFGSCLMRLVKNLNLTANIIFMGRRSYDFIVNFLPRCRVGILTFPRSEATIKAFPYKVLEYAASGLPIVMTDVSAIAGMIKTWRAGFVHRENDIEGISSSVIEMMINDHLWKEHSARAVELASHFDVKKLACREAQILQKLST